MYKHLQGSLTLHCGHSCCQLVPVQPISGSVGLRGDGLLLPDLRMSVGDWHSDFRCWRPSCVHHGHDPLTRCWTSWRRTATAVVTDDWWRLTQRQKAATPLVCTTTMTHRPLRLQRRNNTIDRSECDTVSTGARCGVS